MAIILAMNGYLNILKVTCVSLQHREHLLFTLEFYDQFYLCTCGQFLIFKCYCLGEKIIHFVLKSLEQTISKQYRVKATLMTTE